MPRCNLLLTCLTALSLATLWLSPTKVSPASGPPTVAVVRSLALPHPMPDGHIDRDVQILVYDRVVTIDVRMAASDVTWIEIIRMAESRTAAALAQQPPQPPEEDGGSQEVKPCQPLPTTEEAVAAWLVHAPNRQLLEQWLASTCRLEWCAAQVPLGTEVTSRPDSRHHWSITFQLKYTLNDAADAGELRWLQVAYQEYPGKVRRALKTRGESLIDATDVSPLVVRAEFELRDEDSTPEQRQERITAQLRLPLP
jgi:hypothetical protein